MIDIEKARRLVKKISALVDNLGDQDSASSLERDLLKSYLRDLYEITNAEPSDQHTTPVSQGVPTTEEPPVQPEVVTDIALEDSPTIEVPAATEVVEAVAQPEPDPVPAPQVIRNPEPEPVMETVSVEAPSPVVQGTATATQEVQSAPSDLAHLFEVEASDDLADQLHARKIETIQDEMGINERILTINELFGGDPEEFNTTVSTLNAMSDFISAQKFLAEGPAKRHQWGESERAKKARIFIQLVRRKFS